MTRRAGDGTTAGSGPRSSASRRGSASATARARPSKRSTRAAAKTRLVAEAEVAPAGLVESTATGPAQPGGGDRGDAPTRRRRAKRGDGEQLREQILDATYALLVETGDADRVSTRAVARRVGCSSPALYLHFPDRAGLLWEVCNRQFVRLGELIRAAVADHDDPLDALRAAGRAYVTFGVEHEQEYRVMMMGPETVPWNPEIDELPAEAGFDVLHDLIVRAMDQGVLRPDDPTLVAISVWTTVHGAVSLRIAKPSFPWPPLDDDVDRIIDLITFGLATDRAAAPVDTARRSDRPGSASRRTKSAG